MAAGACYPSGLSKSHIFSVPLLYRHCKQATKNTIFGVLSAAAAWALINAFQRLSRCGGGQAEQSVALLLSAGLQMHIRPTFQTFISQQYQAKPNVNRKNDPNIFWGGKNKSFELGLILFLM